jgi:hypothetical protein
VLVDNAAVLHGHLPAGERHHPSAEPNVIGMKWRVQQRFGVG